MSNFFFFIYNHANLRQNFKDLLLTGDNHDVIITVQNKAYKAHKIVLGARSPVFAAMFKHKMKEAATNSVTIDDIDPEAFGEFLLYLYSGEVANLSSSNALHLYSAADKYNVPVLKEKCLDFLKSSMSESNVCDTLLVAKKYGEAGLLQDAIAFFAKNFQVILKTEKWKSLLTTDPTWSNEILVLAAPALAKK